MISERSAHEARSAFLGQIVFGLTYIPSFKSAKQTQNTISEAFKNTAGDMDGASSWCF